MFLINLNSSPEFKPKKLKFDNPEPFKTERPPFKKGVGRIYEELNILCQPVAINSGYVWPKKGNKISNKAIVVSIIEPINPGLNKEDFIQLIEKKIYSELDLIN